MTMRSKFKTLFQFKDVPTSLWILLSVLIVMIGMKISPANAPKDSSSGSNNFFKGNGVDTRYDYVEPQVDEIKY